MRRWQSGDNVNCFILSLVCRLRQIDRCERKQAGQRRTMKLTMALCSKVYVLQIWFLFRNSNASVAEWSIASDCKSDGFILRWFKSNPAHQGIRKITGINSSDFSYRKQTALFACLGASRRHVFSPS